MENEEYITELRKNILFNLDDLRKKIENNEPCPEQEQDLDMLVDIYDYIENCLNFWNY
jgi:hypothetical protein